MNDMDLHNWREWRDAQFAADEEVPLTDEELAASFAATNPDYEVE